MAIHRGGQAPRVYAGTAMVSAVYRGTTEIWRANQENLYDITASGTLTVPDWAAFADVGVIGGGGGGATGNNGASEANGEGGNAAVWSTATVTVSPGGVLTFTIGAGGTGGTGGVVMNSGGQGGTTSVSSPYGSLSSTGGTGGAGSTATRDRTGHGAAAVTFNGVTFASSANVTPNNLVNVGPVGNAPGGGGGGGRYPGWFQSAHAGGAGGAGRARVRFRSY